MAITVRKSLRVRLFAFLMWSLGPRPHLPFLLSFLTVAVPAPHPHRPPKHTLLSSPLLSVGSEAKIRGFCVTLAKSIHLSELLFLHP